MLQTTCVVSVNEDSQVELALTSKLSSHTSSSSYWPALLLSLPDSYITVSLLLPFPSCIDSISQLVSCCSPCQSSIWQRTSHWQQYVREDDTCLTLPVIALELRAICYRRQRHMSHPASHHFGTESNMLEKTKTHISCCQPSLWQRLTLTANMLEMTKTHISPCQTSFWQRTSHRQRYVREDKDTCLTLPAIILAKPLSTVTRQPRLTRARNSSGTWVSYTPSMSGDDRSAVMSLETINYNFDEYHVA